MWLVPTRRRLAKLRNFCKSATSAQTTTPALIIIDESDYADNKKEYLFIKDNLFPSNWKIHISKAVRMGDKVRETEPIWKHFKWVGILNDDHYLVTKNWDKKLIAQLDGKNFITCNDKWNAPQRAAGATVFSMPLIKAFGFPIFPNQIFHLGIDDVFEQIGRATGCWEVDMSVIVEHHHAFKNPDTIDETHTAVYGTQPWQNPQTGELSPEAKQTQAAFMEWHQNDFPEVVKRVNELRKHDRVAELPNSTSFKEVLDDQAIPVPEDRSGVVGIKEGSVPL